MVSGGKGKAARRPDNAELPAAGLGVHIGFSTTGLPEEVMAEAEPVIRAVFPDAPVPTSVRSTGVPVVHGWTSGLGSILDSWLAANAEGVACVIARNGMEDDTFTGTSRIRSLTPEHSKGLEFDLVVLVDPDTFGNGIEGTVDRYVAMTRATQQLVILTST